jgi:hypothetical protein
MLGGPAPRREFGDAAIGSVVDELGDHQICFRIDTVQLAGLDQRGRHRRVFCAFFATREQNLLQLARTRNICKFDKCWNTWRIRQISP